MIFHVLSFLTELRTGKNRLFLWRFLSVSKSAFSCLLRTSSFFLIIHRTLRHAQEGSTLSKSPQPDFKGKGAEQDVPKGLTSAPFLQSIVLSFILSEETPTCVFHFHCESRKCLIKIKLNLLCFLFTQKSHRLLRGRICKSWHPNLLTRLRD